MRIRQLGFSSNPILRIFSLHFGQHGVVSESGAAARLEAGVSDGSAARPADASHARHSAR